MKKQILTVLAGALLVSGCANLCGVDTKTCSHKKADYTYGASMFAFDSAELSAKAKANLDNAVKSINNSDKNVEVNGYTDISGNAAYNVDLSQRRANAVAKYLTDNGVDAKRVTTKGHGATDFIASNDTAAGRAQNRRVEIVLD